MAESSGKGLLGFQLFCFIMGVPFLVFGIIAFRDISEWGGTWKKRTAMVESGTLNPLDAKLVKKWEESDRGSRDRMVSLRIPGETKQRSEEVMNRELWNRLEVGQIIKVYPVDSTYFIPMLHTGGHDRGRWYFLGFGAMPMALGSLVLMGRRLWKRSHNPVQATL